MKDRLSFISCVVWKPHFQERDSLGTRASLEKEGQSLSLSVGYYLSERGIKEDIMEEGVCKQGKNFTGTNF